MTSQKPPASQRLPKDKILYCERCGISFLWSGEEQQLASHPAANEANNNGRQGTLKTPTHCAGCRHLMPTEERERGLVKWYNPRKRFGFIVREDGSEIFAHGSRLKNTGRLREGALVEFMATESDKGPTATEIHLLEEGPPTT